MDEACSREGRRRPTQTPPVVCCIYPMAQGLASHMALCPRHAGCPRQAAQPQARAPPAWLDARPLWRCARPAARRLTATAVAAVEDAPSTSAPAEEAAPEDEFLNAMDFTNTEDLYARFNQLLEAGVADFKEGDKVTGVIATCAHPARCGGARLGGRRLRRLVAAAARALAWRSYAAACLPGRGVGAPRWLTGCLRLGQRGPEGSVCGDWWQDAGLLPLGRAQPVQALQGAHPRLGRAPARCRWAPVPARALRGSQACAVSAASRVAFRTCALGVQRAAAGRALPPGRAERCAAPGERPAAAPSLRAGAHGADAGHGARVPDHAHGQPDGRGAAIGEEDRDGDPVAAPAAAARPQGLRARGGRAVERQPQRRARGLLWPDGLRAGQPHPQRARLPRPRPPARLPRRTPARAACTSLLRVWSSLRLPFAGAERRLQPRASRRARMPRTARAARARPAGQPSERLAGLQSRTPCNPATLLGLLVGLRRGRPRMRRAGHQPGHDGGHGADLLRAGHQTPTTQEGF